MDAQPKELGTLLRRAAALDDHESAERWSIIHQLHDRTDRPAFDAARALARSDDLKELILGLDILAQIGYPADRPFLEDTLPAVIQACEDDRARVLDAAIAALGHLHDPRGLPAVLRHAGHSCADVRYSAARALPMVAGDPAGADVIDALIRLSADEDEDVRNWATFGIGTQIEEDTVEIREALAGRLNDENDETAEEALVGLARRHDPRALPMLLSYFETYSDPGSLVIRAAEELGAPEALPALRQLKENCWEDDNSWGFLLDHAIAAWTP